MNSDIKLEDDAVVVDGDMSIDGTVNLKNNTITLKGYDLKLDSNERRSGDNVNVPRRALVHDHKDGLTINYNRDYPNGVTVHGPLVVEHHFGVSDDARMYVGGSATFNAAPTVPDLRITELGEFQELNPGGGFGGGFGGGIGGIQTPASLVDIIQDLRDRIKALEAGN